MSERDDKILGRCTKVQAEVVRKYMAEGYVIDDDCLDNVMVSKKAEEDILAKWILPDGSVEGSRDIYS